MASITQIHKEQRQIDPLPPGRYWIEVQGQPNIDDFDQWVRDMGTDQIAIQTSSLDRDNAAGPLLFVIFNVLGGAAFWPAHLGFPNFAPGHITHHSDVSTRGAPQGESKPWDVERMVKAALVVTALVAAGHVLYLYGKRRATGAPVHS